MLRRGGAGPARRPWRLVVTGPLDGPTNMAIDEALLRSRIGGRGGPAVRFYRWRPATVSLGYGQPLAETVDLGRCRSLGIGLVRRPTGGSAILHGPPESELTYSVVAGAEDFPGAEDVLETYRRIGAGLAEGLRRLGAAVEVAPRLRDRRPRGREPAFCFARTGSYEVTAAGRKLVGSAQRRQGGAFLQHGAVPLDADPARVQAVFPDTPEPMAAMTTLGAALGRRVGFDEVADALGPALAGALDAVLAPADLTAAEAALVQALVADKYGTEGWTVHGRVAGGVGAAGSAAGLAG
jgi:lipoate-protein ligase A